MFIHVSHLKPGQKQELKGDLHQEWLSQALANIGCDIKEYSFNLEVEKKGEFIELDGQFSSVVTPECIRCLERFDVPIKNRFRQFFYKDEGAYVGDGGEHELNQDDLDFSLLQGDKIDVGEVLREQLILCLPDYPICDPDCKGINA